MMKMISLIIHHMDPSIICSNILIHKIERLFQQTTQATLNLKQGRLKYFENVAIQFLNQVLKEGNRDIRVIHINVCVKLLLCNQECDATTISKPLLLQWTQTRVEEKYYHDRSLKVNQVTTSTMYNTNMVHNNKQENSILGVPKIPRKKMKT